MSIVRHASLYQEYTMIKILGIRFMALADGSEVNMPVRVKKSQISDSCHWSLYNIEDHIETFSMHAVFWIYTNPHLTIEDYKFCITDHGSMHIKSVTINGYKKYF